MSNKTNLDNKPVSDRLNPDDRLETDKPIKSQNGQYTLLLQKDGNLVLYHSSNQALWASMTYHQGSYAHMQLDGNFVLYSPGGAAVWASNTWGNEKSFLVLQDDGNVVIYNKAGAPIWSTGTNFADRLKVALLALSNEEFNQVCLECQIQTTAGAIAGARAGEPAFGAAIAALSSADCRKCLVETYKRVVDNIKESERERAREARERFKEIDEMNAKLEKYERIKNIA